MKSNQVRFAFALALVAIMPLCGAGIADAGSVFLKNGYILQGRIVERGEGVVVLGWQNGQVTIYDRFIDEVLLDPAEEEMIRQRKAVAQAKEQASAILNESLDLTNNEVMSLPDSYEAILGVGRVPEFDPIDSESRTPDVEVSNGVTETPDPVDSTPETGVETVPAPEIFEKIFASIGVALSVPDEWRVDEKENALRVSSVADPTRDYLTIDLWKGEGVDSVTAFEVLEEAIQMNYPNFLVENGIDQSIDGNAAKTLALSDIASGVRSRQQVVATELGVFVLGLFHAEETESDRLAALETMLDSVRFVSE